MAFATPFFSSYFGNQSTTPAVFPPQTWPTFDNLYRRAAYDEPIHYQSVTPQVVVQSFPPRELSQANYKKSRYDEPIHYQSVTPQVVTTTVVLGAVHVAARKAVLDIAVGNTSVISAATPKLNSSFNIHARKRAFLDTITLPVVPFRATPRLIFEELFSKRKQTELLSLSPVPVVVAPKVYASADVLFKTTLRSLIEAITLPTVPFKAVPRLTFEELFSNHKPSDLLSLSPVPTAAVTKVYASTEVAFKARAYSSLEVAFKEMPPAVAPFVALAERLDYIRKATFDVHLLPQPQKQQPFLPGALFVDASLPRHFDVWEAFVAPTFTIVTGDIPAGYYFIAGVVPELIAVILPPWTPVPGPGTATNVEEPGTGTATNADVAGSGPATNAAAVGPGVASNKVVTLADDNTTTNRIIIGPGTSTVH